MDHSDLRDMDRDDLEGPVHMGRRGFGLMGALGAGAILAGSGMANAQAPRPLGANGTMDATAFGVQPNSSQDQTAAMQAALDLAAQRGLVLHLPAGRVIVHKLDLKTGAMLQGVRGRSALVAGAQGLALTSRNAQWLRLSDIVIDGAGRAPFSGARGLVAFESARDFVIAGVHVLGSGSNGIAVTDSGGDIHDVRVDGCKGAAILSLDGVGVEIASSTISDCADNGILIWRTTAGEDRSIVRDNRISRVGNVSGGSGQYGNGINVFRADGVIVSGNQISDCAYTAVRGNAASNIHITGNVALRSGEVAIYAEFGFEGALIANNLVDGAGTGIAVTNFNEGGRLAVVQGNIIRNLKRREHEPVDKRGEGIGIEADAVVTGNVIENAPTAGLLIGWGRFMRDVVATGNLIRKARIGIAVTGDAGAGQCLIAQNMISGASDGAVRMMDHARPVGGDLAALTGAPKPPRHVTVVGNVVG